VISAIDSSVILDVLAGGAAEAEQGLAAIRRASLEGRLIVG
jgi:hypothetical protein